MFVLLFHFLIKNNKHERSKSSGQTATQKPR